MNAFQSPLSVIKPIGWYRIRKALLYKKDIVGLCAGEYKTDIAKRLMCIGAFPVYSEVRAKMCGKPNCYGDCAEIERCVKCKDCAYLLSDTSPESQVDSFQFQNLLPNQGGFLPFSEDAKMAFSSYYADDQGQGKETPDRHEHVVHPKEFMAYARSELQNYTKHITNVREQKDAHLMFDQNSLPHQLQIDIDFSQNFKMNETKDETQSGNWSTVGCTLFVGVIRFIDFTTWNLTPQFLSECQEVSVLIDDEAGPMYRYAEIKSAWTMGDGEVLVYHPALKEQISYPIERIRLRKIITVPQIVISDYKGHDSQFVRCYLEKSLLGPEGWLQTQTEFPGLKERITELHIFSDGAPSHFKNKGSLHFTTYLKEKFKLRRVTWTFGAAGHGKGTWDGLGGTCKKNMARVIISKDLVIKTAKEVYMLLQDLMDSEAKRAENDRKSWIEIKRWKIEYVDDAIVKSCIKINMTKDVEDMKAFYSGSSICFFFEAFHRDGMGYQLRACWCHACVRGVRINAFGGIHGCLSQKPFEYQVCKRKDAPWLAEQLVLNNALADEILNEVVVGSVIAYNPLGAQKKRVSVFDIGKISHIVTTYSTTSLDVVYLITVQTSQATSPTSYRMTTNEITLDPKELRYLFRHDPIISGEINLSNEGFSEITCAFFNGKQID